MSPSHKAVFLDRDGVINQTVFRRGAHRAPQDWSEWAWVPGLLPTLQALKERDYLLVVCTNQPDVSRGWQTLSQVDAFHTRILRELPVAQVYACFHDNDAGCHCRKPKPGMLLDASRDHDINLERSYMVGDRDSDIRAGRAAGCVTIHMRHRADAVPEADHEICTLPQLLAIVR